MFLEELGLAGHPSQLGGMHLNVAVAPGDTRLMIGSKFAVLIENKSQKVIAYKVPGQVLTTSGRELAGVLGTQAHRVLMINLRAPAVRAHRPDCEAH